jgi:hypothetical protein
MRGIVAFAAIALLVGLAARIATPARSSLVPTCNEERHAQGLLLDSEASRIAYSPQHTTVEALRALPRPKAVTRSSPRIGPAEFETFMIHVKLIAVTRTANFDTLLAVQGSTPGSTMVIVFPDTHMCLPNPGPHGGDIHSATDGVYADCGPAIPFLHWVPLRGTADIEGVALWEPDDQSARKWSSPNRLTLHPALSFLSHGCAQPGALPFG